MSKFFWMIAWIEVCLWAALGGPGCGSNNQGSGDGNGLQDADGGSNPTDGMDNLGDGSQEAKEHEIPICTEVSLGATVVAPNVVFVVDRSGSMGEDWCFLCGCVDNLFGSCPKLDGTKEAITQLLDSVANKIQFGWMQFPKDVSDPNDQGCTPGDVSVQCAGDSMAAVRDKVTNLTASGATPAGQSLQNTLTYFQGLTDKTRSNYVIFLTDGLPNCTDYMVDANQLTIDAITALHDYSIDTFVIGLGNTSWLFGSADSAVLNQMAQAGGRPRLADTDFYPASQTTELSAVLETIGGMVMSCDLRLDPAPEYPKYLWVYFDGTPVERDPNRQNGWEYDEQRNILSLFGSACDRYRNGEVTELKVVMGCAPPT